MKRRATNLNLYKILGFNYTKNLILCDKDGYDKLFKIRFIYDKIRERLILVRKKEFFAEDEQTKCCHELK